MGAWPVSHYASDSSHRWWILQFFPLLPSDSEIIAGVWTRSCFTGGLGVGEGEGRGGEGGAPPPSPEAAAPCLQIGFQQI